MNNQSALELHPAHNTALRIVHGIVPLGTEIPGLTVATTDLLRHQMVIAFLMGVTWSADRTKN